MGRINDPYYDQKTYHMADKMNSKTAQVSALCYKRPRAINLDAGQSWTICPEDVTCPKCRKMFALPCNEVADG